MQNNRERENDTQTTEEKSTKSKLLPVLIGIVIILIVAYILVNRFLLS